MILKFLTIYTILTSLAAVNLVPGNHTVTLTVPNTPKVSAYGWPPSFINVSLETIPVRGIVQYDLLYCRTCPNSCYTGETDLDVKDLRPVNGCHLVVNQTSTLTKSWSCVICNSTKNCKSMGITEDHDLCLVFNVTAPMGSRYKCREHNYNDISECHTTLQLCWCSSVYIGSKIPASLCVSCPKGWCEQHVHACTYTPVKSSHWQLTCTVLTLKTKTFPYFASQNLIQNQKMV